MYKVLQTFYDGGTHSLYVAGLEIADDPALAYAEKRGLIEKIKEEKPKTEVKKEEPKKAAAKKPTTKKTTKKG